MSNLTSVQGGLQYWQDIREMEKEILQGISTRTLQNAECIYIRSQRNRAAGSLPGSVSLVKLRNAAMCLYAGTHVLMNDQEIEAYQKQEAAKRDEMKRVAQPAEGRDIGCAQQSLRLPLREPVAGADALRFRALHAADAGG